MSTLSISNGVLKGAINELFMNAGTGTYRITLIGPGGVPTQICTFKAMVGAKVQLVSSVYFVIEAGTTVTGLNVECVIPAYLEGNIVVDTFDVAKVYATNGTLSVNDIIVELTGGTQ